MEIVKKNIVSIILGVIAIVAVIAAFVPLGSKIEQLQTNLNTSSGMYLTADGLLKKDRKLPAVPGIPAASLTHVPNQAVLDAGQQILDRLETESQEAYAAALAMNKKEVLVANTLPQPLTTEDWTFRGVYRRQLPRLFAIVNGASPLTPERIEAEIKRVVEQVKQEHQIVVGGQIVNQPELVDRIQKRVDALPLELRSQLAERHKLYIEPGALQMMGDKISGSSRLDPVDIWWAQMGLWLQEDILAGIANVNKDATNILDAPVKHLYSIRFENKFVDSAGGGGPTAALPTAFDSTPTGRVSNGMFDVMRFSMEAVVEIEKIPQFVRGMSEDRFITIYDIDISSVDSAAALVDGVVYGSQPVARLSMQGEALFFRDWTVPFMPEAVKQPQNESGTAPAARRFGR